MVTFARDGQSHHNNNNDDDTAETDDAADEIGHLHRALQSQPVIEQAKGLLMAQHGCTPDEAFALLTQASQRENRKLRDVARAMIDGSSSGAVDRRVLAADARDLDHQPLDDLVFQRGVLRHELAGLLGEIHQDRAGLEHRVGLAARSIVIDDHRDFLVRVEQLEFGGVLGAGPDVHRLEIVGKPAFLEHDEYFLHVRAGQSIEVNHGPHQLVFMSMWPASACRGESRARTLPRRWDFDHSRRL